MLFLDKLRQIPSSYEYNSRAPTEGLQQISSPTHITRNPNWPNFGTRMTWTYITSHYCNHKQHRTCLKKCSFSFKVNQNRCLLLDHCFCPVNLMNTTSHEKRGKVSTFVCAACYHDSKYTSTKTNVDIASCDIGRTHWQMMEADLVGN